MRLVVLACCLCACADDPLVPPTGQQVKYAISDLTFATSNTSARELGFDLAGTRDVDNQLGLVLSMIAGMGVEFALRVDERVARGDVVMLAMIQYAQPSDPSDSIAFTLYDGSNPSPAPCADALDTVCRRHLQGDGQFVALPPAHEPLLGERRSGRMTLGPGALAVTIPFFDDLIDLELAGARLRIDQVADTRLAGAIGGGLPASDLMAKLLPPFARYLEARIAAECFQRMDPQAYCGCSDRGDYTAWYWLKYFDSYPKDCTVTIDELMRNSLIASLLSPDVEIDGLQLLSFGFGFEAVSASF
jgi:hypothetical protein